MPTSYASYQVPAGLHERWLQDLLPEFAPWGPVASADGIVRLLPLTADADNLQPGTLSALPLKKLLLPAREQVWSWAENAACSAADCSFCLVVGLPRCELQALGYLDQVFGEDEHYRYRRARMLVVGSDCLPEESCRCRPGGLPLAGDLFAAGDRLWVLSERGRDLLERLPERLPSLGDCPLPEITVAGAPLPAALDAPGFQSASAHPVWRREGQRCLACGACSAVCPTCYCFDMVDSGGPEAVRRYRVWDNCFFPDHGRVAGGFDFRPDRVERLRFRFEHKYLGFGALRGTASCVGCGRCRRACPVAIDLDAVAVELAAEGSP